MRQTKVAPSNEFIDWLGQQCNVEHFYLSLTYIILCSLLSAYIIVRIYRRQIGVGPLVGAISLWGIYYLLNSSSGDTPKLWVATIPYFLLVCGMAKFSTLESRS
jgi:hypothetical protein